GGSTDLCILQEPRAAALLSWFRNGMRAGSRTNSLEQGGDSAVGAAAFGASAAGSGRVTRKSLAEPGRRCRHEYLGHFRRGECGGISLGRRSFRFAFCVDRVGVRAPRAGGGSPDEPHSEASDRILAEPGREPGG